MENLITINDNYTSLDQLHNVLKTSTNYTCTKEYDIWEQRVDTNGQMAKCLVIKKNNMHAVKIHFIGDNTIKATHIIPNKIMQAYCGKSEEARKDIIEIVTGMIKKAVLSPIQKKAFNEIEAEVLKIVS